MDPEDREDREDRRSGSVQRLEQRKLRSRDAARSRRSQETEVFYQLAATLPLPRRVSAHLDKAAIMRLTLSFLRTNQLLHPGEQQPEGEKEKEEEKEGEKEEEKEEEKEGEEEGGWADSLPPQALCGFVLVLTEDGDVVYLTESVTQHLGLTQLELLGQNIYDFIHPSEEEELRDLLDMKRFWGSEVQKQEFYLRMKNTLNCRGKNAGWRVLHCVGRLRPSVASCSPPASRVMVLLCEPLPLPPIQPPPPESHALLTRHSLDLTFTHLEGRVTELIGYKPEDLIGRSAFQFHHALDSKHIRTSLETLLVKGQVRTALYRFLVFRGGFVWTVTEASIILNPKTSKPEGVVCLHYILSAVQQRDLVFSVEQTRTLGGSAASSLMLKNLLQVPEPGDPQQPDTGVVPPSFTNPSLEDPVLDEAVLGHPVSGHPVSGDPVSGDPVSGHPVSGDPVSGDPVSGDPVSGDPVSGDPQDLFSPQLRHLLSPIFNAVLPSSSFSSSPEQRREKEKEKEEEEKEKEEEEKEEDEELMDTSEVERFFAFWPQDAERKEDSLQEEDLDLLAPYISMDDDFQLTFLSSSAQEELVSSSSPEPPAGSRKRSLQDASMELLDKRQKVDRPIEELLLDCLEDTSPCGVFRDGGRSQLLTGSDPVLGGVQGLCDTADLMRDVFVACPASLCLSPVT